MAIQVLTQPGNYQSVHGDLLYVAYEATKANDPVTYPDYRYLADIYVGTELVTRLKAYPDPTNKMGVFNIGSIIRNYISPVFNPTVNNFFLEQQVLGDGEFNVSGVVVFGEEYGFTQYPATIAGVGKRFFGHYNGRLLGADTNLSDYVRKYATVRPVTTKVYRNAANVFLPYFLTSSTENYEIKLFDSSGNQIIALNDVVGGQDEKMSILNISPRSIDQIVVPIFTDETAYYTVEVGTSGVYRFDLVCEPKFTTYTLHFLNRFGGFESRDFTKLSRKLLDIEKKDFGKLPYTINASGVVAYYNSNNVYNETRAVYSSQYKERMTLNTDILTDADHVWLGDLVLSPMVFIEMDGYHIPIVIAKNNYEFRKVVNDRLTNLTIDIEFGEQFNAQYR